jgi:hypothetical protein
MLYLLAVRLSRTQVFLGNEKPRSGENDRAFFFLHPIES